MEWLNLGVNELFILVQLARIKGGYRYLILIYQILTRTDKENYIFTYSNTNLYYYLYNTPFKPI